MYGVVFPDGHGKTQQRLRPAFRPLAHHGSIASDHTDLTNMAQLFYVILVEDYFFQMRKIQPAGSGYITINRI